METSTPADDLLRGIKAIAEFIGKNQRQTFYLAEKQLIPVGKEGGIWTASKTALRDHYRKITGAAA